MIFQSWVACKQGFRAIKSICDNEPIIGDVKLPDFRLEAAVSHLQDRNKTVNFRIKFKISEENNVIHH